MCYSNVPNLMWHAEGEIVLKCILNNFAADEIG